MNLSNMSFKKKEGFSTNAKEHLNYYVYCLVSSLDKKIFYIGKGNGNRVFAHINQAINGGTGDKCDKIREIIKNNGEVLHFILRHGLDDSTATIVESTLINLFSSELFGYKDLLTNIQAGHHEKDFGIKTVQEIEEDYTLSELYVQDNHNLLLVSLEKTYELSKNENTKLEEYTKGWWAINKDRALNIDYVLGVYRGVVRTVFKVDKENKINIDIKEKGMDRIQFNGKLILSAYEDKAYSYKATRVTHYPFGVGGCIRYVSTKTIKK